MNQVALLEKEFLNHDQAQCHVVHKFGPGIYIRELIVPADTYLIGHIQKMPHMNLLVKGRVSVMNDDGSFTELVAPMSFAGSPGRKVGYVHEDMVWQNIYATSERDVENLEEMLLDKSEAFNAKRESIMIDRSVDQLDFSNAVKELGFSEEAVHEMSVNESDMVELPFGSYKFKKGDSGIHGKGIFATCDVASGEVIGPARIGGLRTILGRFTNHSENPNAAMWPCENGDIVLVSIKEIKGCLGGLDGEEITVDYRNSVEVTKCLG